MAKTLASSRVEHSSTASIRPEVRRVTPVKWFAGLGAFFVAFQIFLYGRWVLSGNFTRIDSGPDPIPLWMRVAAHTAEVLAIGCCLWALHRYVYRPWRKDRRVGAFGMMWLAAFTIYWMDWAVGWLQPVGNWTGAYWVNRGSWYNFIPGWRAPNGQAFYELNSFGIPAAIAWYGLITIWLCKLMGSVHRRRPNIGVAGLLGVALGFGILIDFVLEVVLIRLGLYTWGGFIPGWTLFEGHYYNLPLWEPLLLGPTMGLCAALVYFKDDRGNIVTERGLDRVRVSDRTKGWLRFFALAGAINLLTLIYSAAWGLTTLAPGFQWSNDVVNRSYLRGGLCGEGTDFACPADGMPLVRGPDGNGFRVAPNGDLIRHGKIVGHVDLRYR
jgi:hypothetical protein